MDEIVKEIKSIGVKVEKKDEKVNIDSDVKEIKKVYLTVASKKLEQYEQESFAEMKERYEDQIERLQN